MAEKLSYSPIWLKNQSAFTQLDQNEQFYFVKRFESTKNNMLVIGFEVYSFSPSDNAIKVWAFDQERLDFINIDTIYYASDRLQELYAAVLSNHKSLSAPLSNSQLYYLYVWSNSSSCYSNSYGNVFLLPKNVFLHNENRLYFYKNELDTMRLSIIHQKTNQFTYCPNVCRTVYFDQQGYAYIQSLEQKDNCEKNPSKPLNLMNRKINSDKKPPVHINESSNERFKSIWNINTNFLNKLNDDEKLYFVKCSEECNESSFTIGFVVYSYSSISNYWRIWQYDNSLKQFEVYKTLTTSYWVNKCNNEINSVVLMKNFLEKRISKLIPNEKLFKIKIWSLSEKIHCGIFTNSFLVPLPKSILSEKTGTVSRLFFNKNELNSMQLVNIQHQKYYSRMDNICNTAFSDVKGSACFQYKYYNDNCVSLKKKAIAIDQKQAQVKKQKVRWLKTRPIIDYFNNKQYHYFKNYGYVHLNASFYKNNKYIKANHFYFITNISNQDIVYSPISCDEHLCSFYKRKNKGYISCLWINDDNKIYPVGVLDEDWYTKTLFLDTERLKRSVDNDLVSTFQSLSDFFNKYQQLSLQQRTYLKNQVCDNRASCFRELQFFDQQNYADITKRMNSFRLRIKPEIIKFDNGWQLKKETDQIWIALKKNSMISHNIIFPSKNEYKRVRLEKDGKGQIVDYYYVIDIHDEFDAPVAYQIPKKVQIKPEQIQTQPHETTRVKTKSENIQIQKQAYRTVTSKEIISKNKEPYVSQTKEGSNKIWVIFDDYVDNSGYIAWRFKKFKQSNYVKKLFNLCEISRYDLIQGLTIKRRPPDFKIWNNSQFNKVAEMNSLLYLSPHSLGEKNTNWELHLFLARNTRGIGYDDIKDKLYYKLKNLNVKTIIVWEFCDFKPDEITMYEKLFSEISSQNRFNYHHSFIIDDYSKITIPFIEKKNTQEEKK